MPAALRYARNSSQVETPNPGRRTPEGAVEPFSRDRRGPMRPPALTPARKRLAGWTMGIIFRLADAAALAAIGLVAGGAAPRPWPPAPWPPASLAPFAVGALIVAWSLWAAHAYDFSTREGLTRHLARVGGGFLLAGAVLLALFAGFRLAETDMPHFLAWFGASLAILPGLHCLWWLTVRRWRRTGRLTPNFVVVGATANAASLVEAALASREAAVLGVFDDRTSRAPNRLNGVAMLGDVDVLVRHRIMPFVDKIVITVPQVAHVRVRELIDRVSVLPNAVTLYIDQGPAGRDATLARIADAPLAPISGPPTDERRALLKRLEDLVIGMAALCLAAPLMAVIALAIRFDSPGPVFFRQRRHGFNNEEILVWKFRSMRLGSDAPGAVRQVSANDPRVTRVGRVLRPFSLDELPQLFNVLAGEMSLVGPRPHAVGMQTGEVDSAELVARYAHRHRIKPGMTGWAAVNGSRGPVDTPDCVRRRVALDIEYIERQSLMLDLMIMLRTIPCLVGDRLAVR